MGKVGCEDGLGRRGRKKLSKWEGWVGKDRKEEVV
jgi:hypothetical protein